MTAFTASALVRAIESRVRGGPDRRIRRRRRNLYRRPHPSSLVATCPHRPGRHRRLVPGGPRPRMEHRVESTVRSRATSAMGIPAVPAEGRTHITGLAGIHLPAEGSASVTILSRSGQPISWNFASRLDWRCRRAGAVLDPSRAARIFVCRQPTGFGGPANLASSHCS
jgi:hypothetical protein